MRHSKEFFDKYVNDPVGGTIVEVGSQDICGGPMSSAAQPQYKYIGIDLGKWSAVDIVLEDPYVYPFDSDSIDAVVSCSTFEHIEFFWVSFLEMCRVCKPGGHIFICAPSNGPYHAMPVDCWRYYKDAAPTLTKWATRNGYNLELMETFIAPSDYPNGWEDWVGTWRKH
jgi:SAM-dependent methyltransferase